MRKSCSAGGGLAQVHGLHVVAIGIPHEPAVIAGDVPPFLRLVQHFGAPGTSHFDERVDLGA
jgi:hypothetical protein